MFQTTTLTTTDFIQWRFEDREIASFYPTTKLQFLFIHYSFLLLTLNTRNLTFLYIVQPFESHLENALTN